jgi:hypothetical protein
MFRFISMGFGVEKEVLQKKNWSSTNSMELGYSTKWWS